jgi:hypothetical protein
MKRAAGPEFPVTQGLQRGPHIGVMGRTIPLEYPGQAGGIGEGPASIGVIAKAQPRGLRVPGGPQNGQRIEAVEHPTPQSQGLEHQSPGITAEGHLDAALTQGGLLAEGKRQGIIHIYQVPEALQPWNGLPVHVVGDTVAVLHQVKKIGQMVLGHIRHRDDEQAAGAVDAPGVVALEKRLPGGEGQTAVGDFSNTAMMGRQEGFQVQVALGGLRR